MSLEPLSRRSALWALCLAAGGAVVGFVVTRASYRAPAGAAVAANDYASPVAANRLLARVEELPAGGGLVLSDDHVVLTRSSSDAVHGFSAVCTHQGCPVTGVEDGAIVCPCHGSRFDALSGDVLAGPAPRGLSAIPVVVRDGGVYTS